MNCVKTLTNGRISLTKPLTPYEQTLLTTHTQRTQSTNQLIPMLPAAVFPKHRNARYHAFRGQFHRRKHKTRRFCAFRTHIGIDIIY